jgi:pilus assembly protein CpaE
MYPIAIGLGIRSNALWSDVTATLRDLPYRVLFDHPEIEERETLLERVDRTAVDVLLLECTNQMETLEELVAAIRSTVPAPLVIALHASPEVEGVVTALRAGVFEFLYPPVQENLRKALDRAQRMVHRKPPGKVFGFLSAKGGCGATTVACHAAAAMGRRGEPEGTRALLIDLDLNTGMVRFLMRITPPYSVLDAANNLQRLDIGYWRALTSKDAPGLEVIAAPPELISKHNLSRDQVQHVLSFARCHYDWIVVDLGRGLGLLTMSVLDAIDELYLVTTPEVPALHLTRKIVDTLAASNFSTTKVHLIGNRVDGISAADPQELEAALGLPLHTRLPNEYLRLFQSYSECRLLTRGGGLAGEFETLAARMMGKTAPKRNGWAGTWTSALGRLGRRVGNPTAKLT